MLAQWTTRRILWFPVATNRLEKVKREVNVTISTAAKAQLISLACISSLNISEYFELLGQLLYSLKIFFLNGLSAQTSNFSSMFSAAFPKTFLPLGICTENYLLLALLSLLSVWAAPGVSKLDVYYLAPWCLLKIPHLCTPVNVILGSRVWNFKD